MSDIERRIVNWLTWHVSEGDLFEPEALFDKFGEESEVMEAVAHLTVLELIDNDGAMPRWRGTVHAYERKLRDTE
jgi:hypothetical protein